MYSDNSWRGAAIYYIVYSRHYQFNRLIPEESNEDKSVLQEPGHIKNTVFTVFYTVLIFATFSVYS